MKRGRKPRLKTEYEAVRDRLAEAGVKPPPFKDYVKTPLSIRETVGKLLEAFYGKSDPKQLPGSFRIVGEWVSCIVLPDGKTVDIEGKGLG